MTSPDLISVLDTHIEPPPAPLPGLDALRALVADAALRAAALLDDTGTGAGVGTGPGGTVPEDTATDRADGVDDVTADIARFVARTGDTHQGRAAAQLDLPVGQMRLLATAHRFGGRPGVATFLAPQPADPDLLAAAEHTVQPLRPSPTAPVERHHNHLTDAPARVQLRYGPDRLWHPYVERYGTWQPAAAPHPDPAVAYGAARAALRAPSRR
ncbi:hypothetical protein OG259_03385 [Streptomyces sp. NBC_00250]|uniref:hypothetical protein n=1 Tax=Streptomyces sp. NBC_00250 TaxID=2903641 RepID=UPI002E2DBE32|nr:hypothetical protein [Streptomyces sp. NBC_00250]